MIKRILSLLYGLFRIKSPAPYTFALRLTKTKLFNREGRMWYWWRSSPPRIVLLC